MVQRSDGRMTLTSRALEIRTDLQTLANAVLRILWKRLAHVFHFDSRRLIATLPEQPEDVGLQKIAREDVGSLGIRSWNFEQRALLSDGEDVRDIADVIVRFRA